MRPMTLSVMMVLIAASCIGQRPITFHQQPYTSKEPPDTFYTMEELIKIAQASSASSAQMDLEKKIAAAQFDLFKRAGRPLIAFAGNIPVYNKDNFGVVQPDGTLVFRSRSQSNSDANFSVEQMFPLTNSRISLNTYLNRFDDYFAKRTSYNATLFYIQLRQPVFAFNQYKWDKRIEPLRYKESQLISATALHELSLQVCQLYYNVIEAEADLELAGTNLLYARKNRATEERKKELGASTDDKLLQLQMMELEASAAMELAQSRVATSKSTLKNILGMQGPSDMQLRMPGPGSMPAVSLQDLMTSAERTHPLFLAAKRELLEAQSVSDQAKMEGREINVVGSFGVTNTGNNISSLFANTNDQQRFSIGLQIPIYDGGRRKQKLSIAYENEKLVSARSRYEILLLVNEITDICNEYNYVRTNIGRMHLLDSIGGERFIISNRLFEAGKIPITEVQISQREKDTARRNYLRMLRRLAELRYAIRAKAGLVI